jgi:hypothetical protein
MALRSFSSDVERADVEESRTTAFISPRRACSAAFAGLANIPTTTTTRMALRITDFLICQPLETPLY